MQLKDLLPEFDFWNRYWVKNCDPRTANQWLMSGGPWKLFAISLGYCLTIIGGLRVMRSRKAPFEIRLPMLLYNFILIAINAYFFYQSFWWTNYGRDLLSFSFPSPDDQSPRALRITQLFKYYLWTKFVDYFDTFFFILRKKDRQITALHVFHHVSVPMVGWMSNWISPTMPVLGLFVMCNSFCHILMYSYYAISSQGPRIQKYLWWKKYLTMIQLIQFAIIGLYGIAIQILHSGYPLVFRVMPISQAIIYLVLFGNFYLKSYNSDNKKKEQNEKEKEPSAIKQD